MDRRPPPQTGAPRQSMMRAVYGRNLRPMVIATGSLSAIWTLLWAISSFQDVNLDKNNSSPKLANFSLVLGILYIVSCAIEVFGVTAAITQRLALVRAYAIGSVISCLLVVTSGLIEVVVHFVDKNDIITECTNLATNSSITFRFGLFGTSSQDSLTPAEAASFCQDGWNHASWSSIVSLLLEILLGTLFSLIAISYYRQLLDPTSAANAFRSPSRQMRGNVYPEHYDRPYNASVPSLPYGTGPNKYASPAGSPPQLDAGDSDDDMSKPPMYDAEGLNPKFGGKGEDPFADFGHSKNAKAGERDEFHV